MNYYTNDYMEGYKKYNIDEYLDFIKTEQWMVYPDIPQYEVSNKGRIRNRKTKRIMSTTINNKGYETIAITRNNNVYNMRVHRMVAKTFHNNEYRDGLDVNHIDGNKLNNKVDNLEWCTRKENVQHAIRTGLFSLNHRKQKVRIVETGEIFDSITECAKSLGCDRTAVGCCINGKSKTCMGYHIELI